MAWLCFIFVLGFLAAVIISVGCLAAWVNSRASIRDLANKHVFITGGSSGIGFEIAKQALLQNSFVTIVSRSPHKLRAAVQELQRLTQCTPCHISFQVADVGDYDQISWAVKQSNSWRQIDVLVCNAGVSKSQDLDKTAVQDMDMLVQTNLKGTLYTLHAAIPLMKPKSTPSRPAAVVILGSLSALHNFYGEAIYTATKYAQRGIAERLRLELMPYNISVTFSCPTFTDTAFLHSVLETSKTKSREMRQIMNTLNLYHTSMVETPDAVAKYTLKAAKAGKFIATTVFPGGVPATLGRGLLPSDFMLEAIADLLLHIPLRILTLPFVGLTRLVLRGHFGPLRREN